MTTGQGGAGRPLPGYVLRDAISRGATAEVWRGEPDGRPGRVVAIKRLRNDVDPAALEALRRDAETLARLSHPNILPILDIVEDEPGVAIVTPYAASGSLADWLDRTRGGLEPVRVADLGARTGAALAASHAAGITHGDLRPANILFDADGQPLVGDLAVAHLRGTAEPAVVTAEYPDTVSIPDGLPSDAATDIYSLAAILYEALTGVPPNVGSSPHQTLAASDRGVHIPAADLVDVPSDLAATIERGLRHDPATGFSTIAEMADHLDEAGRRLHTDPPGPPWDNLSALRRAADATSHGDSPHGPAAPTTDLARRLLIVAAVLIITIPVGIVTWLAASDVEQAPSEEALRESPEQPPPDASPADGPADPTDVDPAPGEPPDEPTEPVSKPRDASRACPDAVTPTLQAPTQPADIDGQGCSVPAAWDGQILEVAIGGNLQRFDLPGDGQDMLLFGDFTCDGRETPALYRPATGEVFVFPTLDPDDEVTVRAEPDRVPEATARVVLDDEGCARVDLSPQPG